ncbi:hypothetical protein MTO96_047391 [Rhipicephalus appendiculatus]
MLKLEQHLSMTSDDENALSPHGDIETSALYSAEIPLIAIVCQGGTGCNKMVLEHIKKQLPVLVIQGSGGVADLLALAYNEIDRRGVIMWDPEFIENVLKPEINSHICQMFPKFRDNALSRNLFKDRIVECLRIACQGGAPAVKPTTLDRRGPQRWGTRSTFRYTQGRVALVGVGALPGDDRRKGGLEGRLPSARRHPGVIGCIDGTLIAIKAPKGPRKASLMCRKGFYALNVMIICDASMRILAIDPVRPGSDHDSFIWQTTGLRRRFLAGRIAEPGEYLLGEM